MSILLLIVNTKIFFFTICTYVYIFISYINTKIFFYNFYAIATCFQKKSATRSPVRMHEYPAHLTSLVTYIKKDVRRTISNDIILVHFQLMKSLDPPQGGLTKI